MPNSTWTDSGVCISLTPLISVIGQGDVNTFTNADKIVLIAQYTSELSTKVELDTLASTWSVSSTFCDNAFAAVGAALIAAGAPANWTTLWPDGTTSGPWTNIKTTVANLWAAFDTQKTALQSVISNAQALAAQAAAVAAAATDATTKMGAAINAAQNFAPVVVASLPTLPNSLYPSGRYAWNEADGQLYVSAGSTWTVLNVASTSINGTLIAGQIAAGAIGATQIAAGAITTAALTVCDWTNLCYNPGFELGMTSWISQAPTQSTVSTTQVRGGSHSLKLANNGGTYQVLNINQVPAASGQTFLFQVWAMASGAITSGTLGLRVTYANASGGWSAVDNNFNPTTSWAQYTATVTLPAGSVVTACALISWSPVGGDIFVDDCYFRRCSDASLIVDGAITASKILAGAITADMITTGTLNASNVAVTNLNASNITTGTLSATKVSFVDGSDLTHASRVLTNAIATSPSVGAYVSNQASSYSSLPSSVSTAAGSTAVTYGTTLVAWGGYGSKFTTGSAWVGKRIALIFGGVGNTTAVYVRTIVSVPNTSNITVDSPVPATSSCSYQVWGDLGWAASSSGVADTFSINAGLAISLTNTTPGTTTLNVGVSVDGAAPVQISTYPGVGSSGIPYFASITGLSAGPHSLTLVAYSSFGNSPSATATALCQRTY